MLESSQTQRPYDLTIFGASGFAGKYILREALKFLNTPSSPLKTLALAGRNPTKLTETLKWASSQSSYQPSSISIVKADVSDPSSLHVLCSKSKVVLNCVGPFELYGEPVVEACVENGTDYLDICGEPEFMEKMEAVYHEKAAEKGALVVSACGFDSIPAELGLLFNSRQWVGTAALNNVEAYLNLESDKKIVVNLGTYKAAVLGIANMDKVIEPKSPHRRAALKIPGSSAAKGPPIEHQRSLGLWALTLPSADAIVVRRTLTLLAEKPEGLAGVNESAEAINKRKSFWASVKPAYFGVKLATKSPFGLITSMVAGLFLVLFGKFSLGRWLLLNFPSLFSLGLFSKTGPTEAEVESASFKMWFVGRGYSNTGVEKPDMEIVTRITGPETGYITTGIVMVQSALILLGKRDEFPKGGVYPPGIVFGATDLQERLQENGISFDVISKSSISA